MLNKNLSNLVSVIIPYHKKIHFIDKCIESVLNQTLQNFEIILIYDDNELDELNYIKKLVNKDPRIKLIINKKKSGAGVSRNIGIGHGKGSLIAFIDADDVWKKNKLEIQVEFMEKNNLLFCHTSYEIIDKNNLIKGYRKARDFNKVKDLLKSCDIGLSTVILYKKILSDELQFPNLKSKEDFVLWLKILDRGINISSMDTPLTSWRKLDDALSSSKLQKLFDGYLVYRKYMNFNSIKSFIYLLLLSFNYLLKEFKNK